MRPLFFFVWKIKFTFVPNKRNSNMTTVIIDDNNAQAKLLLNYIETLPFVKLRDAKAKNKWETALADGAVTPHEFHAMLENEIQNNW